MTHHIAADEADWLAARRDLLEKEKALTRDRDALAAARRALPWRRIDKPYRFVGEEGEMTLEGLFGAKRQLIVYHFMYPPDWEEGCKSCSFWADNFENLAAHLAARDTALVLVSRAPYAQLAAFRERMGWTTPWVSSESSGFNEDFRVTFDPESDEEMFYNFTSRPFGENPVLELPGISTFIREDGAVYHTYSAYSRGLDGFNSAYQLLDLTPLGRQEEGLDYSMSWLRLRDAYGDR